MIPNLKLGTKFTLMLSLLLLGGIIIGGIGLWQALQASAQAEFETRGLMLIAAMNGIRSYTSEDIGPRLTSTENANSGFIKETIPAFSTREVFDRYKSSTTDVGFVYKEATLNPTNPLDQSDGFETEIVGRFRDDSNLKEVTGFRTLPTGNSYYVAKPLAVSSQSCLSCHSTRAAAPKDMLASYSSEGGFGWQLNEIIGAQFIYVPADEVLAQGLRSFAVMMFILFLTLVTAILLTNFILQRFVIQPVDVMGGLAQKIASDQLLPDDLESSQLAKITTSGDELGQLAQVFRKMARDVHERTQALKQMVQDLHIEIDQVKRKAQVDGITDSDFFRDLEKKTRHIHKQDDPDKNEKEP